MKKEIYSEILINASDKKVWSLLINFNNYKNWNPFIVESSGKAIVGGKLKNTIASGNKKFPFYPKILVVEKNKKLEWVGNFLFKGICDGHHKFEIEKIGYKKVMFIQQENFSGIISNIIFRLFRKSTEEGFLKMNLALKKIAESN